MTPRVSVVIGAYNSAQTLERAARSILEQTVTDLELLIVDDGSIDQSVAVARKLAGLDRRVRVLEMGVNRGISSSLNAALGSARAPVVAVLDADDYAAPERLERQLAVLDARRDVALLGTRMHEVDPAGSALAPRTSFRAGDVAGVLMRFNPIPNTSAAFRRDAVLELGGYDPRYRFAMEYDLWLRLAERHRVLTLPEPLCTRVMSQTNVAARSERAQIAESILIRLRALHRRRTLRGASGLLAPAVSYATPLGLKRALRRRLGQAP